MKLDDSFRSFAAVDAQSVSRLFETMLSSAPHAVVTMVRTLAASRDVTWLDMIVDSGLAAKIGKTLEKVKLESPLSSFKWDASDPVDLLNFLLQMEADPDGKQYSSLNDKWMQALEVTPVQMQAKLHTSGNSALLKAYASRGIHPNTAADVATRVTALSLAAMTKREDSTLAMLDILRDASQAPLHMAAGADGEDEVSFFDALVNHSYDRRVCAKVAEHLAANPMPEEWALSLGTALESMDGDGKAIAPDQTYCKLLTIAKFQSEDRFAQEVHRRGPQLGAVLAGTPPTDDTRVIFERLVQSGVDLDDLPCAIYPAKFPNLGVAKGSCTMLHAAVYADNKEVVKILLDAGADPNLKVKPIPGGPKVHETLEKNAFEFANPDMRAFLEAWRARQAVHSVAAIARSRRAAAAP